MCIYARVFYSQITAVPVNKTDVLRRTQTRRVEAYADKTCRGVRRQDVLVWCIGRGHAVPAAEAAEQQSVHLALAARPEVAHVAETSTVHALTHPTS